MDAGNFPASRQRHDGPNAQRTRRKLLTDLERAVTDHRWLEQSLDAAMAVEALND